MQYKYYIQHKNGQEKTVRCTSDKFISALNGAKRDTSYRPISSAELTHKEKLAAATIQPHEYDFLYDVMDNAQHIIARFRTLAQAKQYLKLIEKSLFYFPDIDRYYIRKILVIYLDNGYTCEYEVKQD